MEQRSFFGCRLSQRGSGNAVDFFIFVANTTDVMGWAGVRRVGEHERGTQRLLKDARVHQIRKFFAVNIENTIPVSVTLAFEPGKTLFQSLNQEITNCLHMDFLNSVGSKLEWGVLSFEFNPAAEDHERLALIVDGQHRLRGLAEFAQQHGEDIPVLIAALIDADPNEQAFQFVVINKKADKVPTDNVKAIIASINEANLQDRLLKAGVNYGNISAILKDINDREDSPFYGLLIWPLTDDGQGKVQLSTIESCMRYIRSQIDDLKKDEATTYEVFMTIWKVVKEKFPDLWEVNDLFMSKVSINALNEFIVDKLTDAYENANIDIFTQSDVESQTRISLRPIPSDLWKMKWGVKIQDSAVVRDIIKDDLRKILQNVRSRANREWYEDLELLSREIE